MKSSGLTICFILALSMMCFAKSDYAVLIQESPVGAGKIKPGSGVHTFNANEIVTLTTVPKPGWHFVYWMGDVKDPTANNTITAVDGPKIIIAVFTRDEYELLDTSIMPISSGPEGLTRRYDDIGGALSGGILGGNYSGRSGGGGGGEEEPPNNPPPVPEENYPPPVPEIPEPATVLLLGMGAWLLIINRKK
jgi:hypothetical protein